MASELDIYSIYKIQQTHQYIVLRTIQPDFSNASQTQEDNAVALEHQKRTSFLAQIGNKYSSSTKISFDFIGEFQNYPIGEKLYLQNGNIELDIYYLETTSGFPWIIIGTASSEAEFLSELNDDEDLLALEPIGDVKYIQATFFTENDFLSPAF